VPQQGGRREDRADSGYAGILLRKYADRNSNVSQWDQKLRELAGIAFGVIAMVFETGEYRVLGKPDYPLPEEDEEEPSKERVKLWDQACAVVDRKQIAYDETKTKLHGMIKLSLDESIKSIMKGDGQRYNDAMADVEDPIKLYKFAKEKAQPDPGIFNQASPEDIKNMSMVRLFQMRQRKDQTVAEYSKEFQTQLELTKTYGMWGATQDDINAECEESHAAMVYYLSLNKDQAAVKKYKDRVQTDMDLGSKSYPKTIDKINSHIINKPFQIVDNRGHTDNYNASFASRASYKGGGGGRNSRAGHGHPNERRQSKFYGTRGVCWDCGKEGHIRGAAACKGGAGDSDSDSDATSVKSKESKASNASKKSNRATRIKEEESEEHDEEYINRMLINSGRPSSKVIIAATTKMLGVNANELLGSDSMSNVSIATNVTHVRKIDRPIEVDTLGGKFVLTHMANWAFGDRKRCFFQEGEGMNILSTYDYRMQRTIQRDGSEVIKFDNGEEIKFQWMDRLLMAHLEPVVFPKRYLAAAQREPEQYKILQRPLNNRELTKAADARI